MRTCSKLPYRGIFLVSILSSVVVGCERTEQFEGTPAKTSQVDKVTDGNPVATVAGQPVFEHEVQRALDRLIGGVPITVDESLYQRVLETVATSRAIAQVAEAEMTADESRELQADVTAYREQRLIEYYLSQENRPEPISSKQIADYYQRHPEKFGGGDIKTIAVLQADVANEGVIKFLESVQPSETIETAVKRAGAANFQLRHLVYEQEKLPGTLNAKSQQLQNVGQQLQIVDGGKAIMLRLLKVKRRDPLPLPEVRDRIVKSLSAVSVKEALANVTEDVQSQVEIIYLQQSR